jgi:hypothetical protein
MDIANMVNRAKNILLTPKKEWPQIAVENSGCKTVYLSWLLPLSLIPALAAFIGWGLIGYSVGGVHVSSFSYGLRQGVVQIIAMLGGAWITAFIINALAGRYASVKNMDKAFALVAYAYTPACLGGIFQLIPSLAFIGTLASLYSLYLIYVGLPPLMQTPPERNTGYFVVSLLCAIVVSIVLSAVLGAIIIGAMYH